MLSGSEGAGDRGAAVNIDGDAGLDSGAVADAVAGRAAALISGGACGGHGLAVPGVQSAHAVWPASSTIAKVAAKHRANSLIGSSHTPNTCKTHLLKTGTLFSRILGAVQSKVGT
jgi:hypothetical protein